MSLKKTSLFVLLFALVVGIWAFLYPTPSGREGPAWVVERLELKMKDGTEIAASIHRPRDQGSVKYPVKYPVIVEMQPYRKEDLFRRRDELLYGWFVQRGFVMVKLDVRGTGSSGGARPEREYSDEEISDFRQSIEILAAQPWSNGSVGVWGISWSAINALILSMDPPKAMKAVIAAHPSDDLYWDDVHWMNGIFHLDQYSLSMENEILLPRSTHFRLDEDYWRDRFDRVPWIIRHKVEREPGPFWKEKSVRYHRDKIKVPLFLIGGLLDGYRDAIPRLMEINQVPVQALMGPWVHAWPHDSSVGPTVEWRDEALKWWRRWLLNDSTVTLSPRWTVFQRSGDPPDADLSESKGEWWSIGGDLPVRPMEYEVTAEGVLRRGNQGPSLQHKLPVSPRLGTLAGDWWGDARGNQAGDSAQSLTFDSAPLESPLMIAGFPEVRLGGEFAQIVAQLEDVSPDGQVALVTGKILKGGRGPLHWTTWTFQPGHRIRWTLRANNFPMAWPALRLRSAILKTSGAAFVLPEIDRSEWLPAPAYTNQAPGPSPALGLNEVEEMSGPEDWPLIHAVTELEEFGLRYEWRGRNIVRVLERTFTTEEQWQMTTFEYDPASTTYEGTARARVDSVEGAFEFETEIRVDSLEQHYEIEVEKRVFKDEKLLREKSWVENIPLQ